MGGGGPFRRKGAAESEADAAPGAAAAGPSDNAAAAGSSAAADDAASLPAGKPVPEWTEQMSLRGLIIGAALGLLFCVITMRLALGSAGIVPSLNVPGGLLSFIALKGLSKAGRFGGGGGRARGAFAEATVQEVRMQVNVCVGGCSSLADRPRRSRRLAPCALCAEKARRAQTRAARLETSLLPPKHATHPVIQHQNRTPSSRRSSARATRSRSPAASARERARLRDLNWGARLVWMCAVRRNQPTPSH